MNEQEFMERMKRAKSKVKDGLFTPIVDMLPEDRRWVIEDPAVVYVGECFAYVFL